MKRGDEILERLLESARRHPADSTQEMAPDRFADRVASRWVAGGMNRRPGADWEDISRKAACMLSITAAAAALTVAFTWIPNSPDPDAFLEIELLETLPPP